MVVQIPIRGCALTVPLELPSLRDRLTAPADGVIFFAQEDPLTCDGSCGYKLIR